MTKIESELHARIKNLGLGVFKDFLLQLDDMYELALDQTSNFDKEISQAAVGYQRDWLANQQLHDIALNYDRVTPKFVRNRTGGHYHTELIMDGAIVTISQVKHSGQFIREAKFRQSLAGKFNPTLFDEPEVPKGISSIYAVVLHGPISNDIHRPGFARIAVPNHTHNRYDYNYSLYSICGLKEPGVVSEPLVEEIQEANTPTLKKKIQ